MDPSSSSSASCYPPKPSLRAKEWQEKGKERRADGVAGWHGEGSLQWKNVFVASETGQNPTLLTVSRCGWLRVAKRLHGDLHLYGITLVTFTNPLTTNTP